MIVSQSLHEDASILFTLSDLDSKRVKLFRRRVGPIPRPYPVSTRPMSILTG